jgi:hypothetical protein
MWPRTARFVSASRSRFIFKKKFSIFKIFSPRAPSLLCARSFALFRTMLLGLLCRRLAR